MRIYIFILIISVVFSRKNILKSKFYLVRTDGGIEGKNQQLKKTVSKEELSMNNNMMKDIEGDVQKKLEKVDDKKDRD